MLPTPLQNRIFVRPALGRRVLDPDTGLAIPPQGAQVPYTTFYARRLKDKDLLLVKGAPDVLEKELSLESDAN